jgi:hypothetical protein
MLTVTTGLPTGGSRPITGASSGFPRVSAETPSSVFLGRCVQFSVSRPRASTRSRGLWQIEPCASREVGLGLTPRRRAGLLQRKRGSRLIVDRPRSDVGACSLAALAARVYAAIG